MNPIILPSAMSKIGRLSSSAMDKQPVWEKENSEFKLVKLHLKMDLVLHPAYVEGLVNTYICVNRGVSMYIREFIPVFLSVHVFEYVCGCLFECIGRHVCMYVGVYE